MKVLSITAIVILMINCCVSDKVNPYECLKEDVKKMSEHWLRILYDAPNRTNKDHCPNPMIYDDAEKYFEQHRRNTMKKISAHFEDIYAGRTLPYKSYEKWSCQNYIDEDWYYDLKEALRAKFKIACGLKQR